MEQLSGTMIKGYELQDRIGAGGFGAVYRAYQSTVGREVAIKIILPGFANRPEFVRRFEAEAQMVARLEHMNITPLYDFWRDPEGAYLVMRYLRGGSLLTALRDDAYDLESAARLLDQVASALAVAHRNHIIHRDIKPANILLDEDGNGYVADFGLAKDIDNGAVAYSQSGDVVGTPDYLSPEQVRSEPVTPRSDIYSLGLVLYEMLTGSHPFPESTPVERMFKQLNEPVPRIASLDKNVAEAINEVIQKATAKNPDRRYQDVLALATAFREAAGLSVSQVAENLVELLTPREQEVLKLIIDGKTNREIGDKLTIELTTVKWYVTQIYRKLNVRSRVQAIVRARELDLIVGGTAAAGSTISGISTLPEPENPYKGLQAFQIADEQDFFGREKLTQKLLARLGQSGDLTRFLAVIGPSGSGKSSLVRAGLIPALWRGDLPGSERWYITDFIPGPHPLDELEVALIQVAANRPEHLREQLARDERGLVRAAQIILPDDDSELVIIIDQFEEVFTLVENEAARTHFLDLLHQAVIAPRSRVRIVITLRADFYDRPLQYSTFGDLVRSRMETVLPLSAEELEQAIIGPVQRVGVRFEDGLVAAIVADINYQPGALPLLQFALTELFEARENRTLTRQGYEQIGRAAGALAKRAEQLYLELADEGREAARQMFLRLVTLGEGSEDTRRRVARSELLAIAQDADLMDEVIDIFAAYRLLALDHDPASRRPTTEVAHEALLREWKRLRQWLDESRADIRLQRLVAAASNEWLRANRDPGFLLHGSRLDQFETWAEKTNVALTQDEQTYLEASLIARQEQRVAEEARLQRELETAQRLAETEKQRAEEQTRSAGQLRRRAVLLTGALVVAGILAVAAVMFAWQANQNEQAALSQQSTAIAEANERATAQAFAENQQATAIAEAERRATAQAQAESQQAQAVAQAIRRATAQANAETQKTEAEHQARLAFSRELALLAINSLKADTERGVLLALQALSQAHTAEAENALHQTVQALRIQHTLPGPTAPRWAAYSPNGQYLAISGFDSASDSFVGGTTWIWDLEMLAPETSNQKPLIVPGSQAAFSPDNTRLVTLDLTDNIEMTIWDLQASLADGSGQALQTERIPLIRDDLINHKLTQDWTRLLAIYKDGLTEVWEIATKEKSLSIEGQTGSSKGKEFTFSPQATYLTIAGADNTLIILDATTGLELFSLPESSSLVTFSPDETRLVTSDVDGLVMVWDVEASVAAASGQNLLTLSGHTNGAFAADFSPDGSRLATAGRDRTARVWDLITGEELVALYGHADLIDSVKFNPDGTHLATASLDGTAKVWDISPTGSKEWLTLQPHPAFAWQVTMSPDGSRLATASFDGTAKILDAESGQILQTLSGHTDWVLGVAFSPDGKYLATASADGTAIIWDAKTGDTLLTLSGHGDGVVGGIFKGVLAVAFSPDGTRLATAGADQNVKMWDVITGKEVQTLTGHTGGVTNVIFSPDGKLLATGSDEPDATVKVWDAVTGQVLLTLPPSHFDRVWGLSFSPDGRYLATSGGDGTAKVWWLDLAGTGAQLLATITGHTGTVGGVAFHPDGTRLATAGADDTTRLWDVSKLFNADHQTAADTESVSQLLSLTGGGKSVTFSPDGRLLATGRTDGTVHVYVLSIDELVTLAKSRLTRALTPEECRQYLRREQCPQL